MNAIQKAIYEVKQRIPKEVLDYAFIEQADRWRRSTVSVDQEILRKVIRPRVMIDCSLMGGTEVLISLTGIPHYRIDNYTSVFSIPKDRTNNRSIISILNVGYTDPSRLSAYGVASDCQNSPALQLAGGVLGAQASIPMTSTASAELIDENVVMVKDTMILPANISLHCVVGYDEMMSNIQMRSYRHFVHLCTLATKAYIYNTKIIPLDRGALTGGADIGEIKNQIDQYADATELYDTYLVKVWQKVAMLNDRLAITRQIKRMVGGYR